MPIKTTKIFDDQVVSPGSGAAVILFLLAVLSIVLIPIAVIMYKSSCKKMTEEAEKRLRNQAREWAAKHFGAEPDYLDVARVQIAVNSINASGFAVSRNRIIVIEKGVAAELPWSSIRSWNWKVSGYEQIRTFGPVGLIQGAQVDAVNRAQRDQAKAESGFFIQVADIEKPEWHVQTDDMKMLKKWHEIFLQLKETCNQSTMAQA
ncbi:hypothetical protein J2852_004441 [Azospirillum soli]|nr:hypothetical protein [Azospirillum soli]